MFTLPPTKRSLAILTPPSITTEPFPTPTDCVELSTLNFPGSDKVFLILTSPPKVTGPSNCERICRESPPSTIILSLTVISSKIALNLAGSSPVTVGIGVSNEVSSPVEEDFLVLPI